jgi:DNA polymerase elongation subunit (family B)
MLVTLLNERKAVNAQKGKTEDPLLYAILDALQNALKVVANSIYGQTGSTFSPIYCLAIAETTTYRGRCSLDHASFIAKLNDGTLEVVLVYGDTDSIFIGFPHLSTEEDIKFKIEETIRLTKFVQGIINSFLVSPMGMAYEKTYYPFAIESKKRYFGRRYEKDGINFTVSIMGIEIKKRDRSEVCKKVLSKVIKGILDYENKDTMLSNVNGMLLDMVNGKYPLEMFSTSKSYKGTYEKSQNNSMKILADRITMRDPGSKPNPGDRLQYLHILNDKKLQGEKIELLSYVKENHLLCDINKDKVNVKKIKVDYVHYLVNQIKTPLENILLLIFDKNRIEIMFSTVAKKYENITNGKKDLSVLLGLNIDENEQHGGLKLIKTKTSTKKAHGVVPTKRKQFVFN